MVASDVERRRRREERLYALRQSERSTDPLVLFGLHCGQRMHNQDPETLEQLDRIGAE